MSAQQGATIAKASIADGRVILSCVWIFFVQDPTAPIRSGASRAIALPVGVQSVLQVASQHALVYLPVLQKLSVVGGCKGLISIVPVGLR